MKRYEPCRYGMIETPLGRWCAREDARAEIDAASDDSSSLYRSLEMRNSMLVDTINELNEKIGVLEYERERRSG